MPPRQRLDEPWATPAQIDFLNSKAQVFQDTIDDKFGRKRFWADLRKEWLSRWEMTDRQNRVRGLFYLTCCTNLITEILIPFP